MVKYLFLDAKWEQRCASIENDANELLELAGIGMSDDGKVTDRIFRIVRPEGDKKISKGTKFFLNLTDKKIATGASLHTALTDFLDMFSEFQWIIVWNYRVYEIFLAKVRKCQLLLPEHKVLVLQDLIKEIDHGARGQLICLEKALRRYSVNFDVDGLHDAKYDTEQIRRLYLAMHSQYKRAEGAN